MYICLYEYDISMATRVLHTFIIIIIIKTLFHEGKNTLQPGAEKLVALIPIPIPICGAFKDLKFFGRDR